MALGFTGFTGLKMNLEATRYNKEVQISYHESYQYLSYTTALKRNGKSLKFASVFLAELFTQRINNGQRYRYNGIALT